MTKMHHDRTEYDSKVMEIVKSDVSVRFVYPGVEGVRASTVIID